MMARSSDGGPLEGFAEQPPEKMLKSQFGPLQTEISLPMCSAVPPLDWMVARPEEFPIR
jgi:hypothetical protein